jgi:hypothetical protein
VLLHPQILDNIIGQKHPSLLCCVNDNKKVLKLRLAGVRPVPEVAPLRQLRDQEAITQVAWRASSRQTQFLCKLSGDQAEPFFDIIL